MLVAGREVNVTNPDKVFFPKMGLTKGDLVQYYVDVSDAVLHHVARRPMQMKRHPNGVEGDFFYQKRVPNPHPEWLETVHISYPSGNEADFPVVTDAAGLAWIANLGCIELHTWHSRVDAVTKPDYLLIDLDPSEGNPWSHVREIALAGKQVLDELGVASFPKTSGATGFHILVPIVRELEFPLVREIARAIAKAIVKLVPTIATTQWKVASTTARTRSTGPSRPPTPCGPSRTLVSRRRSAGTRSRTSSPATSRSGRCAIASRASATSRRGCGSAR